ncbi:MAG: NAD(P)/FAD-dependent oxidoreductase [Pseudomonadales bacterium]|nr:NAD(P)/FAD-dependent oxidoreductase [Pseudomonadales bacterium]MCP5184955.1 NAD(P)/FAD-dependent oxidoreductase [Pseudomonadales bacterium]
MTQSTADLQQRLGFDPDALRNRYREERDKRLRDEGNEQYVNMTGDYSHYIDDPYLEEQISRAPLTDTVNVLIVGGGFGGLLAGARLREAGIDGLRIVEKAGDFGGTWYWNRYPGAACDIESYVYLPLLEEVGYMPARKYSTGREILWYSQEIARRYRLYDDVLFQTQVTALTWQEDEGCWLVETNRGDAFRARYVVQSNGPLNRPKLPGIPGIQDYRGHTFHTSRWDYDYTGGSAEGGLNKLADKKVAIIGTGATAVQCVPHLGEGAQHLYVFQRTPSSIDVRNDRDTDQNWWESLQPGWHQARMDNFNILVSGGVQEEDLVKDGWTEIIRNLLFMVKSEDEPDLSPAEIARKMELADFQKMNQIRARVDAIVADPQVADALKPWYRQFCKRPCFHDDYLPTFNRDNVTLVDTGGHGVERITEKGVVANGVEYPVDCIVFSTGFEVGTAYARRCGYETYGVGGQTLSDKWADGMRSYHGMHVNGFPNLFLMGANGQTGFTANYPHALNEQSRHIAYILDQCARGNQRIVEATPQAEEAWVQTIVKLARLNEQFLIDCTPGYYNNEGKPQLRSLQNTNYGAGPVEFYKLLEDWRGEGQMEGLRLA